MTRRLPTASALERAARCPGSCSLPVVREESVYSARGTALHAFLADVATVGRDAALARVPDQFRAACDAIDLDALPPLSPEACAAEVALAYDPDMDWGRELGRCIDRTDAYGRLLAGELGGTADLVALTDDAVTIADYKTGHGSQTPARHNWQLRALALYASRTYERPRAIVALIHLHEDGSSRFDRADFDAIELDEIRDEIRAVVAAVQAPEPAFARGPWCRHCGGFDACPAQHALLGQVMRDPEPVAQEAHVALQGGPGGERRAYELWQALQVLTARVGERIAARASYRALDLGGGRFYGRAPGRETVADAELVQRVLGEHYGAEVADAAVIVETALKATKAQIQKALKVLPKTRREEAIARLRAAGALKVNESLREYVAGEAAPAAKDEAA
jgi:hypothetical protein